MQRIRTCFEKERNKMFKKLRALFDKYIMAAAYGEAGIPHMAKEILND